MRGVEKRFASLWKYVRRQRSSVDGLRDSVREIDGKLEDLRLSLLVGFALFWLFGFAVLTASASTTIDTSVPNEVTFTIASGYAIALFDTDEASPNPIAVHRLTTSPYTETTLPASYEGNISVASVLDENEYWDVSFPGACAEIFEDFAECVSYGEPTAYAYVDVLECTLVDPEDDVCVLNYVPPPSTDVFTPFIVSFVYWLFAVLIASLVVSAVWTVFRMPFDFITQLAHMDEKGTPIPSSHFYADIARRAFLAVAKYMVALSLIALILFAVSEGAFAATGVVHGSDNVVWGVDEANISETWTVGSPPSNPRFFVGQYGGSSSTNNRRTSLMLYNGTSNPPAPRPLAIEAVVVGLYRVGGTSACTAMLGAHGGLAAWGTAPSSGRVEVSFPTEESPQLVTVPVLYSASDDITGDTNVWGSGSDWSFTILQSGCPNATIAMQVVDEVTSPAYSNGTYVKCTNALSDGACAHYSSSLIPYYRLLAQVDTSVVTASIRGACPSTQLHFLCNNPSGNIELVSYPSSGNTRFQVQYGHVDLLSEFTPSIGSQIGSTGFIDATSSHSDNTDRAMFSLGALGNGESRWARVRSQSCDTCELSEWSLYSISSGGMGGDHVTVFPELVFPDCTDLPLGSCLALQVQFYTVGTPEAWQGVINPMVEMFRQTYSPLFFPAYYIAKPFSSFADGAGSVTACSMNVVGLTLGGYTGGGMDVCAITDDLDDDVYDLALALMYIAGFALLVSAVITVKSDGE